MPRLRVGGQPVDTRSPLSASVLYSNANAFKQAAIDWANFAASAGQALTWQNVGGLSVVRSPPSASSPWRQANNALMRSISLQAWPKPNSPFFQGSSSRPGFVSAFTPVVQLLGGLITTPPLLSSAIDTACQAMNSQT